MKHFNRLFTVILTLTLIFALLHSAACVPRNNVLLAETPEPTQTTTMTPTLSPKATPNPTPTAEPTPKPIVLSFSPNTEVSPSSKISVLVKDVTYTKGHSIDISLVITNNDSEIWNFVEFYGAVNGYGMSFFLNTDYLKVGIGSSEDVTITAQLSPELDEILEIKELQSVQLLLYVYPSSSGASQFFLDCNTLNNPNCSPDYVQNYPANDSALYESKTFKASLARLDWENRTVYLYIENLIRDHVHLTDLYPAVNGYCSQNVVYEGYLPSNFGKTILVIDLSVLTNQYNIDSLKRLALSGNQSTDLHVTHYNQYTIPILTEDLAMPEIDETGTVWCDDDNVKIIYQGIEITMYTEYLKLLLVNKTSDLPLFIPAQKSLLCGNATVLLLSDVTVAPNSACEISVEATHPEYYTKMHLEDKTISGHLFVCTALSGEAKLVADITINYFIEDK